MTFYDEKYTYDQLQTQTIESVMRIVGVGRNDDAISDVPVKW